jgi:hypothetical protein
MAGSQFRRGEKVEWKSHGKDVTGTVEGKMKRHTS